MILWEPSGNAQQGNDGGHCKNPRCLQMLDCRSCVAPTIELLHYWQFWIVCGVSTVLWAVALAAWWKS